MPVDGVSNALAAQAAQSTAAAAQTQGTGGISYNRNNVSATSEDLTMTDFYKLMAAQMQYQDPDNPMDTSELMASLVQSKMITAMAQMTTTNMITYATSMLGKQVTMAEIDAQGRGTGEYTKGTITGVSLAGEEPTLYMGDKAYKMSQIMSVGDVKLQSDKDEEDKTEGGDTGSGDTGSGDSGTTESGAV